MRDTIYRQDAVMEIANHLGIPAENWMKIAEEWLQDVPSAEPRKGKWIKRSGTINCSICKHSNWSECFEDTVMSFNYCPNCGAEMERRQDG